MTRCQVFESPMNKKTENNLASSKEGDGKDNCKTSDVHLPNILERKEKNKYEKEAEKAEQHSESTCPRRPYVMYAKFIRTNARFYNEPVCYIEHPNMKNNQNNQGIWIFLSPHLGSNIIVPAFLELVEMAVKKINRKKAVEPDQAYIEEVVSRIGTILRVSRDGFSRCLKEGSIAKEDWCSHEEIPSHHCVPSYDSQSTQRSDFKIPACQLILPNKHCRKEKPACGIVPLAISETLPVNEKKISHHFPFIHQFKKSLPPKHHGAFLKTDIKSVRGPVVPRGTEVFQSAARSRVREQSKTEKGN